MVDPAFETSGSVIRIHVTAGFAFPPTPLNPPPVVVVRVSSIHLRPAFPCEGGRMLAKLLQLLAARPLHSRAMTGSCSHPTGTPREPSQLHCRLGPLASWLAVASPSRGTPKRQHPKGFADLLVRGRTAHMQFRPTSSPKTEGVAVRGAFAKQDFRFV